MHKFTYFLELFSKKLSPHSVNKPIIGAEEADSHFSFTVSRMPPLDVYVSIYHDDWAVKNIHQTTEQIDIPLENENDDIHFEIYADEQRQELLLAGCIQLLEKVKKPIFVVGSPRSGTSIVAEAIRKSLGDKSQSETHILTAFAEVEKLLHNNFYNSPASQNNTMSIARFPLTYTKAEVIKLIRNAYTNTFSSELFIDKTPGKLMLSMLDLALYAFPESKVIFCKRRGIENVLSRMKKFKSLTFEQHMNGWVKCFEQWKVSHHKITSLLKTDGWYTEIDQYHIANTPEYAASLLAEGLSKDGISTEKLANIFTTSYPEAVDGKINPTCSLESTDWTDEEKHLFLTICSESMFEQGYSVDNTYFSKQITD